MGGLSIWHWIIVLSIVVVIFGIKRLRSSGSDLGNSVRDFKRAITEAPASTISEKRQELQAELMVNAPRSNWFYSLREALLEEAATARLAITPENSDRILLGAIGPALLSKLELTKRLTGPFLFCPEGSIVHSYCSESIDSLSSEATDLLRCVARAFERTFPGTCVFLDMQAFDSHIRCHYWT